MSQSLNESAQSLTPVRYLDSLRLTPHSPRDSPNKDSNVAACRSRLEIIIKTLQDNYDKWQLAHKRGVSLCSSIESIKIRALEGIDKSETPELKTAYPEELKTICDKLAIITSIFVDITKNTREALRQLRSLSKLPGSNNEIFYRSWQIKDFVGFVDELAKRYAMEADVKQIVMQHLPHCRHQGDLIRMTCIWEYPQYVDEYVKLMFVLLGEEIKINKK